MRHLLAIFCLLLLGSALGLYTHQKFLQEGRDDRHLVRTSFQFATELANPPRTIEADAYVFPVPRRRPLELFSRQAAFQPPLPRVRPHRRTVPKLFGYAGVRRTGLSTFPKWQGVLDEYDDHLDWRDPVWGRWFKQASSKKGKKLAEVVNKKVNATSAFVHDVAFDAWKLPRFFMDEGGDCEDFAIAKYFALRKLGVPEEDLLIVVLKRRHGERMVPHALLAMKHGSQYLILDHSSFDSEVRYDHEVRGSSAFQIYYAVDATGWYMYKSPKSLQLAAAW